MQWSFKKGIQVKFFIVYQNGGKSLKCIRTNFKTLYVLPFSKYCGSKLTIFLLFHCCHFADNVTEDYFWKVCSNLLEKQLIYSSDLLLCVNDSSVENTYWKLQTCSNFLKFLLAVGSPGKFLREKSLRWNLKCRILGIEGRTKPKFGDVSLQICQIFLRENRAKMFDLNALLIFERVLF